MKKLFFVLLAAFTIFSCQKKDTAPAAPVTQDVEFGISEIDPSGGQKSTDDWICKNLVADYVEVDIYSVALGTTSTHYPLVFRLAGKLYTQAIKLDPGSYKVTKFLLMDDNGTPGNLSDDAIVMATPVSTSDYAPYVAYTLDYPFTVGEFVKTEVPIDVLCFLDVLYDKFGFNWFALKEIVIREVCFFGDICLNEVPRLPDYLNGDTKGLYGVGGVVTAPDVIAVMQIVVKSNGALVAIHTFNNETAMNDALCVQYPDVLGGVVDNFTFDLYLWLPDGAGGWSYQLYHTFTATDDGAMSTLPGADDVIEFVVGTCNYSTTDIQLPWIPIP